MDYASLMKDAELAIKDKHYATAEEMYSKVISFLEKEEKDTKWIQMLCEAYNNLGYVCYRKVEFNRAVNFYNKSLELNTTYGIAYYNRGTIFYRLGFYETALKDMEKAVSCGPKNSEFKSGLEECRRVLELKSD